MSQPTRASRRQHSQGGSSAPPPRRDPMTVVYISVAVLVGLIVVGLGLMRWQQTRVIAQAYATPTPAPSGVPLGKPIQLVDGQSLGAIHFGKKFLPDVPTGGLGQNVDGMTCGAEYATLHVHSHLAIYFHGKQIQVPQYIGIAPVPGGSSCAYWIHSHDPSGIIHVESPQLSLPAGGTFNLGVLFDVWGQPLTRSGVAGMNGEVISYVNGVRYDGDLRAIPLSSHEQIVLEIGTPTVPPPNYTFPPDD